MVSIVTRAMATIVMVSTTPAHITDAASRVVFEADSVVVSSTADGIFVVSAGFVAEDETASTVAAGKSTLLRRNLAAI
jgi:hypothetical protein